MENYRLTDSQNENIKKLNDSLFYNKAVAVTDTTDVLPRHFNSVYLGSFGEFIPIAKLTNKDFEEIEKYSKDTSILPKTNPYEHHSNFLVDVYESTPDFFKNYNLFYSLENKSLVIPEKDGFKEYTKFQDKDYIEKLVCTSIIANYNYIDKIPGDNVRNNVTGYIEYSNYNEMYDRTFTGNTNIERFAEELYEERYIKNQDYVYNNNYIEEDRNIISEVRPLYVVNIPLESFDKNLEKCNIVLPVMANNSDELFKNITKTLADYENKELLSKFISEDLEKCGLTIETYEVYDLQKIIDSPKKYSNLSNEFKDELNKFKLDTNEYPIIPLSYINILGDRSIVPLEFGLEKYINQIDKNIDNDLLKNKNALINTINSLEYLRKNIDLIESTQKIDKILNKVNDKINIIEKQEKKPNTLLNRLKTKMSNIKESKSKENKVETKEKQKVKSRDLER